MSQARNIPFVFIAENLALDLVNTQIMSRRKKADLLQIESDVAEWWTTVQAYYPDMDNVTGLVDLVYDAVLFETVKELRGNLRQLFSRIADMEKPHADEIAFLNTILQRGNPTLDWANDEPQFSYWYGHDIHASLLLPVALSALNLITRADLDRLHHCQNNNCILMFYDTTKSGTRRWCSTACMDRERSARRYREQKEGL